MFALWRDATDGDSLVAPSHYRVAAPMSLPLPVLTGRIKTEICVIGGGLMGLCTALRLAQAGRDVTLLEAGLVGDGASGRNGGFVLPGFTGDLDALAQAAGHDLVRALWQDTRAAVDLVGDLAQRYAPSAGFRRGVLTAAAAPAHGVQLRELADQLRRGYHDLATNWLDPAEARALVASERYHGALLDTQAGQVDPWQLAQGLAAAARAAGVRLFERSPAVAITPAPHPLARTPMGEVHAEHIVLAANVAVGDLTPSATPMTCAYSYVMATEPLSSDLIAQSLPGNLAVYDTRMALNYFRLTPDRQLIFGGGFSFSPWRQAQAAKKLRREMIRLFPALAQVRTEQVWGGPIDLSRNGLTEFRRDGALWLGHGFSGHGVALACWGGQAIAEAILGETAAFDRLATIRHGWTPRLPALRAPVLAMGLVGDLLFNALPKGRMVSL